LAQLFTVPRVRVPSAEYFVTMYELPAAGPESAVSVSVWTRRLSGEFFR